MADSDPTAIPKGLPAERVDELYGLPLDEFTPARDALAKELRSGGDRDGAGWVKALRKPSATAWLVNQLARSQRKDAERLIKAGEQLQGAQERVLAGTSSSGELAKAGVEQSEAIRDLMSKAPGMLDRNGHAPSDATLEKAEQTLRAAVLDEQAREEFAAGRVTREHRAAGFGMLDVGDAAVATATATAAPKPGGKRTKAAPDKPAQEKQRRAEDRARAKQELKEARAAQASRRRAVTEAKSGVSQARRDAERADRKLRQAEEALEKAEAAEAEAAQRVAEADSALKRAS